MKRKPRHNRPQAWVETPGGEWVLVECADDRAAEYLAAILKAKGAQQDE